MPPATPPTPAPAAILPGVSTPVAVARCGTGGLLMGVANIVPGISGGAMLLLLGVYAAFLNALAELVSLRWLNFRAWVVVGAVGAGAVTSIIALAGPMKYLLTTFRAETYAVLIGMRLGVIPTIWKLAGGWPAARGPHARALWIGATIGLALTAAAAIFNYRPDLVGQLANSTPAMALGGTLAASATILPGLDGSYLLILMGLYAPILGMVDAFKDALLAADVSAASGLLLQLAPFIIGAFVGIGGVALLLRWLMRRYLHATMGTLLGVLVGAFVGLYPFAQYEPPTIGQEVRGRAVTAESLQPGAYFGPDNREHWPLRWYTPTGAQLATTALLIAAGLAAALLLARFDPEPDAAPTATPQPPAPDPSSPR